MRDFCLSRGLGDVYERKVEEVVAGSGQVRGEADAEAGAVPGEEAVAYTHLTLATKRIVYI